jgi:tetratricopeptide (TPR) repeat protein
MRRAHSLVVVLVSVFAAGCPANPAPKDQVQQDIVAANSEKTPDKLLARGRAFQSVGDLTRAEQYYAAALQEGANPKEVLPLLLRVCIEGKRYRVAIEYAEPYLKKHPDDWRLRLVVAALYGGIGEPNVERAELEQVLAVNPNEATGHYALAVLLRDEYGDVVGADAHFREYLRLDPQGDHADEAKAGLLKPVTPEGEGSEKSQ